MFKSVRVKETFVRQIDSFSFLNLHRTFVFPLLLISLMFVWAFTYRNTKQNTAQNIKKDKAQGVQIKQASPELSSKEIADLALENLVVIEPMNRQKKVLGIGSGFFILPNVIATNAHVVEDAYALQIRHPNSQLTDVASEVIAIDKAADIALIRTTEFTSNNPLKLGNTDNISIGTPIYAAGNPQGLKKTFTDGLVSNKQRSHGIEFVQISAPISEGSSGGPVLDSNGNVIGVSTAYLKHGQNLNIAVPSVYISRLVMRTESFYPLPQNSELKKNTSIQNLFPQVCSYLIDIDLPNEYFGEISEKDLQSKDMRVLCEQSMPTCKKAWLNRLTKGVVLIGSHELPSAEIEKISRDQFEELTSTIIDKTKKAYRQSTDKNTKFKISTKDINQHTYRLDIESHYSDSGTNYTDYRSMYFVLPYCRLDVLYSSSGKDTKLDGTVYNVLNDNFVKSLPGNHAEKALFKFEK